MGLRGIASIATVAFVGLCLLGLLIVATAGNPGDDDGEGDAAPTADAGETRRVERSGERFSFDEPPAGTPRAALGSGVAVVERVQDAVVTVLNRQDADVPGVDVPVTAGMGTGFVVSDRGFIVTNWHVVDGGESFAVVFADGERREATLVGEDELSDLAVIRVEGNVPAVVPLGDSSRLQAGQPVLAIGSPLGSFTNTVTQGVVSALGRSLEEQPGNPELTGLIQHDAAINPGNSGGPLFNFAGEVVGVNTLGIQRTRSGEPAQGLFFAIPANTVREIAAKLIEDGEVRYPYLGVEALVVTPDVASDNDLPVEQGVYLAAVVDGGPADGAGLREGDIIVAIAGVAIDRERSFTEVLFAFEPGETVTVDVVRGDEERQTEITLGERPQA